MHDKWTKLINFQRIHGRILVINHVCLDTMHGFFVGIVNVVVYKSKNYKLVYDSSAGSNLLVKADRMAKNRIGLSLIMLV